RARGGEGRRARDERETLNEGGGGGGGPRAKWRPGPAGGGVEPPPRHASDVDHVAALVGAAQSAIDAGARRLAVPVVDGTDDLIGVVRALDQHRIEVEDVALRRPTLDEVFLTLTGQPMDSP